MVMNDHPRQQLQHILLHYGRSICDDPKRCEALLRDLCPDNRREVNLLVMALREGVAHELLGAGQGTLPMEAVLLRLSQRLQDHLGTAEHLAFWTVEAWALALGVKFAVPKLPPRQSPPSRPTVSAAVPSRSAASPAAKKQSTGWQKIGTLGESLAADSKKWSAVRDEKSSLMWAVNPSTTAIFPNPIEKLSWSDAMAWMDTVNAMGWCGFHDWRLPSVDELKTLLIPDWQLGLRIRRDLFPDIPSVSYFSVWSSSTVVGKSNSAWIVHFDRNGANHGFKEFSFYVRLVRTYP